jgi:predicted HTH domain antitoxin
MKRKINIEYPESLANALNLSESEFKYEVKISSIVKLFELGKISSGIAAKVLGLSRIEFIELLAKYKVSIYGSYDIADLKEDIANV